MRPEQAELPGGLRTGIANTPELLDQILALQQRNLFSRLSAEAQAREGFVFVEHSPEQLAAMAARMPQAVVLDGDHVVGYSLCMAPEMRAEIPRLVPMFEQFDRLAYRGRLLADWQYVVGGQVCVDADWRGKGLIRALYETTRHYVAESVELCVTEVAIRNPLSLRAHYRIGFETVDRYRDAVEHWEVVAWPWHAPPD